MSVSILPWLWCDRKLKGCLLGAYISDKYSDYDGNLINCLIHWMNPRICNVIITTVFQGTLVKFNWGREKNIIFCWMSENQIRLETEGVGKFALVCKKICKVNKGHFELHMDWFIQHPRSNECSCCTLTVKDVFSSLTSLLQHLGKIETTVSRRSDQNEIG